MCQYFPEVMARLNDGDIVRLGDMYRNVGVFLVYRGQIVNLGLEDGFHDYGLVPRRLRLFYPDTWTDYEFANSYPGYGTEEGEKNLEQKENILPC